MNDRRTELIDNSMPWSEVLLKIHATICIIYAITLSSWFLCRFLAPGKTLELIVLVISVLVTPLMLLSAAFFAVNFFWFLLRVGCGLWLPSAMETPFYQRLMMKWLLLLIGASIVPLLVHIVLTLFAPGYLLVGL